MLRPVAAQVLAVVLREPEQVREREHAQTPLQRRGVEAEFAEVPGSVPARDAFERGEIVHRPRRIEVRGGVLPRQSRLVALREQRSQIRTLTARTHVPVRVQALVVLVRREVDLRSRRVSFVRLRRFGSLVLILVDVVERAGATATPDRDRPALGRRGTRRVAVA
jgi:hypothetical protein